MVLADGRYAQWWDLAVWANDDAAFDYMNEARSLHDKGILGTMEHGSRVNRAAHGQWDWLDWVHDLYKANLKFIREIYAW